MKISVCSSFFWSNQWAVSPPGLSPSDIMKINSSSHKGYTHTHTHGYNVHTSIWLHKLLIDSPSPYCTENDEEEDLSGLHPGALLYRSVAMQHFPLMADALAHGADVNWVNVAEDSRTPLIQAALAVSVSVCACVCERESIFHVVSVHCKSITVNNYSVFLSAEFLGGLWVPSTEWR